MPIKDTWEIRGWEVIPLLLTADSLERIIPRDGCWGMHSLQKEMLLLWSPVQNGAPWEQGSHTRWVSAGTPWMLALQVLLWQQKYLSAETEAAAPLLPLLTIQGLLSLPQRQRWKERRAWGWLSAGELWAFPSQFICFEGQLGVPLRKLNNFLYICISFQLMRRSFIVSTNPIPSAVYSL